MSEKLYSARCSVTGHNPWCEVCEEKIPSKRGVSSTNMLRRHRDKDIIKHELELLEEDNQDTTDIKEGI